MQGRVCSLAEVLYRHFLEEAEKNVKDFGLDRGRPGNDWNGALPEHRSKVLPIHQPVKKGEW
jgi:hypothetical protein